MKSSTGKLTITIHILPSRSNDNQTMKFGQLIEYNMRIFFLKTNPKPFPKNQTWAYLLISSL